MNTTERLASARDPLGRAVQADFAGDFAPLGNGLHLETNSPEILEACRVAFGRYGFTEPGARTPRFVIRLLVDPSFTETPPWPVPVFRGQGAMFYVSVGTQNTAVADLERRYAVGFVSPAMARDTGFLQGTFLECLTLTMATHGAGATHTYVHASAVARGDKGFIFSGPRESGKTTLAYACARRGFHVVADDVVYLNEEEDGLTAWGRPWRLRLLPDCVHLFPELSPREAALSEADKGVVEIEVEDFLHARTRVRCKPAALFFLDRTGGPATCEPLEPGSAAMLLAQDLIYDLPEVMEKHRRVWMRVAQTGSYVLHYGEDLDSVIHLLESFL